MEDCFKAIAEIAIETAWHLLWDAVEHTLQQCRPRVGAGIVLGILPLIATAILAFVIHDSGLSPLKIFVGGSIVSLLAFPSAYCFLTLHQSA